jgi:centrosomal protein CEP104
MKDCPLLIECNCEQVIEIACLNEHLLSEWECNNSKDYKQCSRCSEAVHVEDFEQHVTSKNCKPQKPAEKATRCPLCKVDVPTDEEEQNWRSHLLYQCKENPRRQI